MILALALLVVAFAVRGATTNRLIRRRAVASASLFAAGAAVLLVSARVPLDVDLAHALGTVHTLALILGVVTLIVTLAINPWRVDRIPERFPNIVQDSIIIAVFALVALLLVRQEFMATTAASALVVGFALQDTLGNLFAGLAIQIEKPFQVGHWVNIAGRDGLVTEVTWRATKIRTKTGNLIVVPNNVLAKDTITNYSVPTPQFRLEVDVGVDYNVAPNDVKAAIRATLADEPLIDHSRDIDVLMFDFAASAITYRIRVWTTDFAADERLRDAVRSRVYHAFRRQNIDIPYPVQVQLQRDGTPEATGAPGASVAAVLKGAAIFATLSSEQQTELAAATRAVMYAARETVVREGDQGSSMFVVSKGELRVLVAGSGGEVARLGPGDYFGEMSLLTGQPRTATVVAATDCWLVEIAVADFRRVVLTDPEIVDRVTEVTAFRRAELERHRAAIQTTSEDQESPRTFLARVRRFLSL